MSLTFLKALKHSLFFAVTGLLIQTTYAKALEHNSPEPQRFWQTTGQNYSLGSLQVIGRKTWKAKPPIPEDRLWIKYPEPLCRNFQRITVHHTHSLFTIQSLQKFHQTLDDPKADIAYHFFIDTDGTLYEARPLGYVGSHSEADNTFNVGIVLNGDFQTKIPALAQQKTLNQLIPALKSLCPGGYPDGLWTHRERKSLKFPNQPQKQTTCPGDHLDHLTQRLKKEYHLKDTLK